MSREIYLESRFINKDIFKNLKYSLKKQSFELCTKETGYITEIHNLLEIYNIKSSNKFSIKFRASRFKPEIGNIYNSIVFLISHEGIIVKVKERMNIFIPSTFMKNFNIYEKEDEYICENDEKNIKIGDSVQCEVTSIKYSNKNFKCIGIVI